MRTFCTGFLLGLLLGAAGCWYFQEKARSHPEAERRFDESAAKARDSAAEAAHHLSDAFKAKLETLNLSAEEIKDELARTGKVVRRKARDLGEQTADAAVDARVVTAIKAKLAVDPDLSAWKISVAADQGHVTLSGSVSSPEHIAKAMALALETSGVRDVTSTLEIKPKT